MLHCADFAAARCRSCTQLVTPYSSQLLSKQANVERSLSVLGTLPWLAPHASATQRFRNKAKLAAARASDGSLLLGIVEPHRQVELAHCPLYLPSIPRAVEPIRAWLQTLGIEPYDLHTQRGELKFLHVVSNEGAGDDELMIRLVLRSRAELDRIRKHLPALQSSLPNLRVMSCNIQPEHKAIQEGDQEFLISDAPQLHFQLNELTLCLQAGGFFQTNTGIAAALYRAVRSRIRDLRAQSVHDLYCGVGGFALHAAAAGAAKVHGFEISAPATSAGRIAALANGLPCEFSCVAAEQLPATAFDCEALIVNPPRRGIGSGLVQQIAAAKASRLFYSSCNPQSLAGDLLQLRTLRAFTVVSAQLFDMFPHTEHVEVLVELELS
jgi:23S rRNA (uracil747-C5)-methyltransferase